MIIKLIADMIGTTLILMFVWIILSITQLFKKTALLSQINSVLENLFRPILSWIRDKLPAAKIDYSAFIFVFGLWIMQKILLILA